MIPLLFTLILFGYYEPNGKYRREHNDKRIG